MTFYITTLGCKVNQYESEYMRELLLNNGFDESRDSKSSDINIINSCTVTSVADAKNRKIVNRIRRENNSTIIILTGCMPQTILLEDDIIYDKCDIILGNTSRNKLLTSINNYLLLKEKIIDIDTHKNGEIYEDIVINNFEDRTRAFVKIEDGCNQFCTYCTIPFARGRVRSKTINTLRKEIQYLSDKGFKEIVLVGINLSCYGLDEKLDITDAVSTVAQIDGIERIRLGSYEPERLTESMIIKLSKEPKFCPQFHLSLQSGCTNTLKRMHRNYTADEYYEIVTNIRKHFNNPSITTDIITGFPGETDEEFLDSYNFVKKVGFSKVHIFPYSRRKGTKAYNYLDQISDNIKKDRCKRFELMTEKSRIEFMISQLNRIESILFETIDSNGFYVGYTKNYIPVKIKSNIDIRGQIIFVKILSIIDDYCIGEVINE